jgi:hypothetical protein
MSVAGAMSAAKFAEFIDAKAELVDAKAVSRASAEIRLRAKAVLCMAGGIARTGPPNEPSDAIYPGLGTARERPLRKNFSSVQAANNPTIP